jgi:hypothetical protein
MSGAAKGAPMELLTETKAELERLRIPQALRSAFGRD